MAQREDCIVLYDRSSGPDSRRAEWLAMVLESAGCGVDRWTVAGANWVEEIDRAVRSSARLFVVFSGHADAAVQVGIRAAVAADPTGSQRRLVPVLFAGGYLTGVLGSLNSIILTGLDGDAAEQAVLVGLGLKSRLSVPALLRIGLAPDDPLPRLQALTGKAVNEAGDVAGRRFTLGEQGAPSGLYVQRDAENEIVQMLRAATGEPVLVSGDGGVGKTSLLWGVASRLLAAKDGEVFFVKASWLAPDHLGNALVSSELLAAGVQDVRASGRTATVLLDTADLLVSNTSSYLALMDAILAAGASVAVTSRPREADVIRTGLAARRADGAAVLVRRRVLGDFALPGPLEEHEGTSEFERAVTAHALEFCREPGDTSELARQLLNAAIRRHGLGQIAQHPLTLRMLFELYAPRTVPPNVDPTNLYQQFWWDRIVNDRRSWAAGEGFEATVDCSATVERISLEMLQSGSPELDRREIQGWSTDTERELLLLVDRGVGRFDLAGQFTFFHQTFFEFAAAQALLHRVGGEAIELLLQRLQGRQHDFVLLSVLEQTWICAWRDPQYQSQARGQALKHLGTQEDFALARLLQLVLVQAPQGWTATAGELAPQLQNQDAVPLPVVRDVLALLPRPGRPLTRADTSVLGAIVKRDDAAWHSVVDLLTRMANEQPEMVQQTLVAIDLAEKLAAQPGRMVANKVDLPQLMVRLMHASGDTASLLNQLTKLVRAGKQAGNSGYIATVLTQLAGAPLDQMAAVTDWADLNVGGVAATGELIRAHAELHRIRAERRLTAGESPEVLAREVEQAAELLAEQLTFAVRAAFGGKIMALAQSLGDGPALLGLLAPIDDPAVHGELHRGWLVPLVRVELDDPLGQVLAAGLPAPYQKQTTSAQRWADTVRRTIGRDDVQDHEAARVAVAAASALRPGEQSIDPWLDLNRLLRVVVKCAAGGHPDARAALEDRMARPLKGEHWPTLFIQWMAAPPQQWPSLLEALAEQDQITSIDKILHTPEIFVPEPDLSRHLALLANSYLLSTREKERRAAGRVLTTLAGTDSATVPPWELIVQWLAKSPDPTVRGELAKLCSLGIDHAVYDVDAVIQTLHGLLSRDGEEGLSAADTTAARKWLVHVLATRGPVADLENLLQLAFRPPVTSDVITSLIGFVVRNGQNAPTLREKIELVTAVGERIMHGIGKRMRKDVPGRWRGILNSELAGATAHDQLFIVDRLSRIDFLLAAVLVDLLQPALADVRNRMESLVADPATDDVLRRRLSLSLQDAPVVEADLTWWDLNGDLHRFAG